MNEITLQDAFLRDLENNELRGYLDNFNKAVSKAPPADQIKKNPFANNAQYLPIGYLEQQLDQVFLGLWQAEIVSSERIGNSVCVAVHLKYFHPTAKIWLTRPGCGSQPVQVTKSGDLQDKAIQKAYPAALTEAIKNAAKKIGRRFGRDLNRDFEDAYNNTFYKGLNE